VVLADQEHGIRRAIQQRLQEGAMARERGELCLDLPGHAVETLAELRQLIVPDA
jgi:hypothetical protein